MFSNRYRNMAQVAFLDSMLREYLVFRGYSNTLKALDLEQRNENDQHFRAERLIDHFNMAVQASDLNALRSLWLHLDNCLFSKLDQNYAAGKWEIDWSCIYLIKFIFCSCKKAGK